jgi:acylglycerol lipase
MPAIAPVRLLLCLLAALLCCQCAAPRLDPTRPRLPRLTMDSAHNRWTCRDGKELPFTKWSPPASTPQRGVVICIHGLSGAASDFWPAGEHLPPLGFTLYGMQLRGQGNDPDTRRRGDINSHRQWREDLRDFTSLVRRENPDLPLFWFGESLGALITIDSAGNAEHDHPPDNSPPIAGIILASPVVSLRDTLRPPPVRNLLLRSLLHVLPDKRISLEKLGNSEVQVTSNTTHRGQMQHTAHYVKDFTFRLFREVDVLMRGSSAAAARINIPTLVLYTPNDPLTPPDQIERFFNAIAAPDRQKVFFPNSYHLILHDVDRPAALDALTRWLTDRSPTTTTR